MMLIASLVECSIPKTPMWQRHNVQLANFDVASLRVIWFRCGSLLGWRQILFKHLATRDSVYPMDGRLTFT